MKVNELMVGDWVEVPFLVNKPKIVKVEEILSDEINPCWDGMENYGGIKIKYVNPISLTPQILRKNGFAEINDNEKWFKLQLSENDFIGLENFEDDHWIFGAVVFPNLIPHLSINYVHELQRALRLCKSNKQIKL